MNEQGTIEAHGSGWERKCGCGCGLKFVVNDPRAEGKKYVDRAHKQKAYRQRKRGEAQ